MSLNTFETVDEGREFKIDIADNVLTARTTDPYGFWQFSFKRGQLPEMLRGAYSSERHAREAAKAYIATKKTVTA